MNLPVARYAVRPTMAETNSSSHYSRLRALDCRVRGFSSSQCTVWAQSRALLRIYSSRTVSSGCFPRPTTTCQHACRTDLRNSPNKPPGATGNCSQPQLRVRYSCEDTPERLFGVAETVVSKSAGQEPSCGTVDPAGCSTNSAAPAFSKGRRVCGLRPPGSVY